MSVTKWIHLNWGDEGVMKLFRRVYELLEDDGIFIVEPQPWKSYKKKYAISAVCFHIDARCTCSYDYLTGRLIDRLFD
jgi:hypothetical protein